MTSVTIELPNVLVQQLASLARQQQRSVAEVARERFCRLGLAPSLPDDVEMELALFIGLSDNVLWLLARSTMQANEREELADLNELAKQRDLTEKEQARQTTLLDTYDRTMVRRAHAAFLLKKRGYDLSDPNILHAQ